MQTIKKHIPNLLTTCNIVCGCTAIVLIFNGSSQYAAYLVFAGTFFDFFDGFAARLLKVSSPIGKDLDSLADMVTFSLVPGFLVYKLISGIESSSIAALFSLCIPVFSAWRLAKFNNDPRQTEDFIGLPTPANAIFFMSIPLIMQDYPEQSYLLISNLYVLPLVSLVLSLLLVSEVRLFSLKIKSINIDKNVYQLILIVMALLLFSTIKFAALPIVIVLYLILSVIKNIFAAK